jgi:hypothetical protein
MVEYKRIVTTRDIDSGRRKMAKVNVGKASDDFKKELQQEARAEVAVREQGMAPERVSVATCNTCQHPNRDWIEFLLIRGMAYKTIGDRVSPPVSRQSISTHHKKHMDLQDAALRAIIEDEARLQGIDHEQGVRDAITKRAVLEIALRKGLADMVDGVTTVEVKDLVQISKLLGEMDSQQTQVGLDELRAQMQLFIQAIKNVCDEDTRNAIANEVARLRKRENISAQIEAAMDDERPQDDDEYIEAEVIDE